MFFFNGSNKKTVCDKRRFPVSLLILAFLCMAETSLPAYLLDWNTVSWANGSLSNTYSNVNGSGVDVTVSITGSTTRLAAGPNAGDPQSPYLSNTVLTGGQTTPSNSLFILANYSNTTQQVVVTVTFSKAVANVNYTLFDVDRGTLVSGNSYTFTDQISNITSSNGTTTYASSLSTVGTGSTMATSGTGTSQIVFGTGVSDPTQNLGNLTVNNGSQSVTSSTFTYGSYGATTQANPDQQGISLANISFTVVPEPSWALASVLLCFWGAWKSRRGTRRPSENN
jgi:hypothetical protein